MKCCHSQSNTSPSPFSLGFPDCDFIYQFFHLAPQQNFYFFYLKGLNQQQNLHRAPYILFLLLLPLRKLHFPPIIIDLSCLYSVYKCSSGSPSYAEFMC